jgi:hypothetical protein
MPKFNTYSLFMSIAFECWTYTHTNGQAVCNVARCIRSCNPSEGGGCMLKEVAFHIATLTKPRPAPLYSVADYTGRNCGVRRQALTSGKLPHHADSPIQAARLAGRRSCIAALKTSTLSRSRYPYTTPEGWKAGFTWACASKNPSQECYALLCSAFVVSRVRSANH